MHTKRFLFFSNFYFHIRFTWTNTIDRVHLWGFFIFFYCFSNFLWHSEETLSIANVLHFYLFVIFTVINLFLLSLYLRLQYIWNVNTLCSTFIFVFPFLWKSIVCYQAFLKGFRMWLPGDNHKKFPINLLPLSVIHAVIGIFQCCCCKTRFFMTFEINNCLQNIFILIYKCIHLKILKLKRNLVLETVAFVSIKCFKFE